MLSQATRFPKLRMSARTGAVLCPLCLYASILVLGAGNGAFFCWSFILGIASSVALLPWAVVAQAKAGRETSEKNEPFIHWLPGKIANFFLFMWLVFRTEFLKWFDQVIATHALWDWRLITAGAIWTISAIFKFLKIVNEVSDEEIFRRLNQS